MSGWDDNKDMGDALKEITNGTGRDEDAKDANSVDGVAKNTPTESAPVKNEEAHNLARERGWVTPEGYDYKAYVIASGAAPAVVQTAEGYTSTVNGDWAHAARKYEWDESFGDVGPKNQALEEQLFRLDSINRQGIKFNQ